MLIWSCPSAHIQYTTSHTRNTHFRHYYQKISSRLLMVRSNTDCGRYCWHAQYQIDCTCSKAVEDSHMLLHTSNAIKGCSHQFEESWWRQQAIWASLSNTLKSICQIPYNIWGYNKVGNELQQITIESQEPCEVQTWCWGPMRSTSKTSASLFNPPCRLSQNFIKYLMSYTVGK